MLGVKLRLFQHKWWRKKKCVNSQTVTKRVKTTYSYNVQLSVLKPHNWVYGVLLSIVPKYSDLVLHSQGHTSMSLIATYSVSKIILYFYRQPTFIINFDRRNIKTLWSTKFPHFMGYARICSKCEPLLNKWLFITTYWKCSIFNGHLLHSVYYYIIYLL